MAHLAQRVEPSNHVALDSTPIRAGIGHRSDGASPSAYRWILVLVGVVAFGVRLLPVMSGSGLYALASYDGSAYYTAAAGLAHGLLPYRDFLLLHPPGIAIALLPFAMLGERVGDPQGLAVARVAWMALGAVSATLVARILRPVGPAAVLVGGLFYAVFVPALRIDRITSLEAAATPCILGAMLIASRWERGIATRARSALLVGALLGISASVKIWGVVIVLAVVVWASRVVGIRRAGQVALGGVAGASAICLPFFLAAPTAMWRMVVLDQLGRHRTSRSVLLRVTDMAGLPRAHSATTVVVVAVLISLLVLTAVLAVRTRPGRLGAVVLGAALVLLFSTPTWFLHYSGLSAAPLAVVVGAAAGVVAGSIHRRPLRLFAGVALLAAIGAYTVNAPTASSGEPFPARQLSAGLAGVTGCVTADDPSALIELNVLQHNFQLGCPLMADLGGYTYDLHGPGHSVSRRRDRTWQQHLLDYLGSGQAAILIRFHQHSGLSARTVTTIHHWSVRSRVGKYVLRDPTIVKTHRVRAH
jgi:alpha-1,2-mannosyltransferase